MTTADGRFAALIVERAAERGGGWFGVGGHVSPGETFADAARRVLAHKAGLAPASPLRDIPGYLHEIPILPVQRGRYPPDARVLSEYAFWVPLREPLTPTLHPAHYTQAQWLPLERGLARLTYAMHARALRLAAAAMAVQAAPPRSAEPATPVE